MRKLVVLFLSLTFSVVAQTTLFTENFNRGAVVQPISNGGTPVMTYTTNTTGTGSANAGGNTSNTRLVTGSDYSLQILSGLSTATPTAQTAGRTTVTAPTSTFGASFSQVLNSNTGVLTWYFNMKTTRSTALSGFSSGGYASVVVLASTDANFAGASASGYCVVLVKGTTTNTVKLCSFASGLLGTGTSGNTTQIIAPTTDYVSANQDWVSVKVVYNPVGNLWKLFLREDGTTLTDAASGVLTQIGNETANSTFTSSTMTNFGFFLNGSAGSTPTSNSALFDNFKLIITPGPTSIAQLTNGIAASPLVSTSSNNAILGFSLTEAIGVADLTALNINTSSASADKFTNVKLFTSTDNSYATAGDNTEVTSVTINQTSGQIQLSGMSVALSTTAKNFFLVADPASGVNSSTPAIQLSFSNTDVTVSNGTVSPSTLTGVNYTFVSPTDPAISTVGGPFSYGAIPVGGTSAVQSYTLSGSNLSSDLTVTAPTAFEVSTSSNSGFGSSLVFTPESGSVSSTIYVRFAPSLADGSHSASVTNASAGATTSEVVVSGIAVSAEPTTSSTAITFGAPTPTSITVNWSNGDGANHLLLVKTGSAVNATPVDGTTYTAALASPFGTTIGTGNAVAYLGSGSTATITGLTKGTSYYFALFEVNGSGGAENYLTSSSLTGYQAAVGTITSATSGNWKNGAIWTGGFVPTASDNVIINHAIIQDETGSTAVNCYDLTINSGGSITTASGAVNNIARYIQVAGKTITNNGTFGFYTPNSGGLTSTGDGLSLYTVNTVTLTGTGIYNILKILPNGTNAGVIFDSDVLLYGRNSTNDGSAAVIQLTNGSNTLTTVTVNNSKTVTFADYSKLQQSSSQNSDVVFNTNITVNGSMIFGDYGFFVTHGGTGSNISLTVNGTLTCRSFLPAGYAAPYQTSTVVVNNPGVLTIGQGTAGTMDFSNAPDQTITGTGTVNFQSGGTAFITSPFGLDPVNGHIRTTTRNFSTTGNYTYNGSAAQVTGADLPATVNNLTVNNAAGLTLSNSVTLGNSLYLTSGRVTLGEKNLNVTTAISGTFSTANMVVATSSGMLNKLFSADLLSAFVYPIGDASPAYTPVTLNTLTAEAYSSAMVGANVHPEKHSANLSSADYLNRYWTLNGSGFTNPSYTATFSYAAADVAGIEANMGCGKYNGSTWLGLGPVDALNHQFSTGIALNSFSDFTAGEQVLLPVELSSFSVSFTNGKMNVKWTTATELNSAYFNVERALKSAKPDWIVLGKVDAAGISNASRDYSFTDISLRNSGTYLYRLVQYDLDGSRNEYPAAESTVNLLPNKFVLDQNYPNPFNPSTEIRYGLPADSRVQIKIYTVTGQLLQTLVNENQSAGYHTIRVDASGLSSGMYIYQITAGNFVQTKKMVVLK